MHGYSFKNGIDNFLKSIVIFSCVLKNELISSEVFFENNSRTIQKFHLTVEFDLLQSFSASRNAGDFASFVSFETVNDTAFANVRVSDESYCYCTVRAFNFWNLFDELYEMVGSDGFCWMDEGVCHVCAICDWLFEKVERRKVVSLTLKICLEHYHWVLSAKVGLPSICILHGNEINFVQNKHDFLIWHRQYFSLDVLASAGKRVSCI